MVTDKGTEIVLELIRRKVDDCMEDVDRAEFTMSDRVRELFESDPERMKKHIAMNIAMVKIIESVSSN